MFHRSLLGIVLTVVAIEWNDTRPAFAAERPVLIVHVSVDQFVYEYLERFQAGFSPNGILRRCEKHGAWFDNCHHRHAFTLTGPGHAVQLTGAYPSEHGIIENDWFDRSKGLPVYCVFDPTAKLVGKIADDKPVSPRSLLADTLGDRLKLVTRGKSKVFGVAIKDRAAILMVGRLADAAFWMSNAGEWITSDAYRDRLPGYLDEVNQSDPVGSLGGQTWDRLLPADRYQHGPQEDSFGEKPFAGMTADFPHTLPQKGDKNLVKQVAGSPFGNDVTVAAALAVFFNEQLGQDEFPDILAIGLSSNDYVGHAFGPQSLEVEDIMYRTDIALGKFADLVDEQLKGRSWIMTITGDHGVAPIPEVAAKFGLPAKRNPLGDPDSKSGNIEALRAPLEAFLRKQLSVSDPDRDLVQAVTDNQVYLLPDHSALASGRCALAQSLARDWLLRHESIVAAVTRQQLLDGTATSKLDAAFRRSFYAPRSGDVLFALAPYQMQASKAVGTTHGSPWQYDTHVPLLMLGFGRSPLLKPGRYSMPTSPAAVAPTLARLLRVDPPSRCVEEAIVEVLAKP